MIRVEAPSRLHFGLLSLPGQDASAAMWPDSEGNATIPGRHFGGVGLMIEHPGVEVTVALAAAWASRGPCAARALTFAQAASAGLGLEQPFELTVERCPPEHVGLGTGTQLGLAVARGVALAVDRADVPVTDLAKMIGRGRRSALGIHGFTQGGFLVEGGKHDPNGISPLVANTPFPKDWAVLLVIAGDLQGDHGQRETEAFQHLRTMQPDLAKTNAMCRLVLLGMLPAILERDLESFGAALYDFNRRVGELFQPWQGGVYTHPRVAKIIAALRDAGAKGVGHSSWGPTVFGIVAAEEAGEVSELLMRRHGVEQREILQTQAANAARSHNV